MNSPRVRVLGTLFFGIPFVTWVAEMAGYLTMEQFVAVVTLEIALLSLSVALAAVVSGLYIWWVYKQRKQEAAFLRANYIRDMWCSLAAFNIGWYLFTALLHIFSFGPPWGGLWIAFWVVQLMWGVPEDALLWRVTRRVKP